MTLLDQGDHIITTYPTYQQLYSLPKSLGVEVDHVYLDETDNWKVNIDEFEKLIKENTKMICLSSPNNPTGTSFGFDELKQLVLLANKHDLYILVDEAYRGASFSYEDSISDLYKKGISTSGLSKTIGLPGVRIGWIKGPIDLINKINDRRDYHIISTGFIHDYLAYIALKNYKILHNRTLDMCKTNKAILKEWVKNEKHISYVESKTGTLALLKYDIDIPSKEFCIRLQKETGVFFVPGACFGVEGHLRFGVANNTETIKEGLKTFSKWLKQFD